MKKGWTSGEGFDYINGGDPIDQRYAWKNLKYWWENEHINPSGQKTTWVPKSKKVWFTEFGCPSIDKATNQPNIFFDPKSQDGGTPKGSSGQTDFSIQRICLKASLEYFSDCEFLEKAFIWTWDARPYPSWPHSKSWSDGYLWEKGHWLNGKLSSTSLEILMRDLCIRANIDPNILEYQNMDQKFDGMIIETKSSIFNIIQMLRETYFFDISVYFNKINFVKRGNLNAVTTINKRDLIKKDPYYLVIDQIAANELTGNIQLNYLSAAHNYYSNNIIYLEDNKNLSKKNEDINLPIVMSENEAKSIINMIIKNANYEKEVLNFRISFHYIYLKPADLIDLIYDEHKYRLRIVSIEIMPTYLDIISVPEISEIYHMTTPPKQIIQEEIKKSKIISINQNIGLSYSDFCSKTANYYIVTDSSTNIYLSKDGRFFQKSEKKLKASITGRIVSFNDQSNENNQIIDYNSEIIIILDSQNNILPNAFEAYIGGEIIYCSSITSLDENKYLLKTLYRNLYDSKKINGNYDFILIDRSKVAEIPSEFKNIKIQDQQIDIDHKIPKMLVSEIRSKIENDIQIITWITKHPYLDNWSNLTPNQEISYVINLGEKEYIMHHDNNKATQKFETSNINPVIDIVVL